MAAKSMKYFALALASYDHQFYPATSPHSPLPAQARGSSGEGSEGLRHPTGEGNSLFNLKSFNDLKKDQTNIKIFKNSSFDSSFNSIQGFNTNLSHISLSNTAVRESDGAAVAPPKGRVGSAILRAIRTIRLNRDEWKLIRYINLIEKKIKSSPFSSPAKLETRAPSPNLCHSALASPSRHSYRYPSPTAVKERESEGNNNIFSNNIINKNILLQNMKYNFLKSTLSSILRKKLRSISEVLENKPIKNYVLYSYLNFFNSLPASLAAALATPSSLPPLGSGNVSEGSSIFASSLTATPTGRVRGVAESEGRGGHLNGGRTKLSLNKYKGRKFGSFISYNKIIGYKFNSTFYQAYPNSPLPVGGPLPGAPFASPIEGERRGNIYIKDIYKLLFYLFKSMYCLISKPVLKYTNDKVTIQLFYYLNIPKKKIFRLFSIFYINSIKKKWLAQFSHAKAPSLSPSPLERGALRSPHSPKGRGGSGEGLNIRWKLRKAISRFKNKNISSPSLNNPCSLSGGASLSPHSGEGAAAGGRERNWSGGKNLFFKLRKFNLTAKAVYQNKFKLICAILSNKFNKPVELQLIRLHHPYHDSNILVNLLSLNIKNKRKKARVAVQKIYNKKPVKFLNDPNLNNPFLSHSPSPSQPPSQLRGRGGAAAAGGRGDRETGKFIPAFLSGLNIKIAGRLMGEPIIPRITTKVFGKGASAIGKVNYLDMARITKKNRKGAYTIKITSGQNFF